MTRTIATAIAITSIRSAIRSAITPAIITAATRRAGISAGTSAVMGIVVIPLGRAHRARRRISMPPSSLHRAMQRRLPSPPTPARAERASSARRACRTRIANRVHYASFVAVRRVMRAPTAAPRRAAASVVRRARRRRTARMASCARSSARAVSACRPETPASEVSRAGSSARDGGVSRSELRNQCRWPRPSAGRPAAVRVR